MNIFSAALERMGCFFIIGRFLKKIFSKNHHCILDYVDLTKIMYVWLERRSDRW